MNIQQHLFKITILITFFIPLKSLIAQENTLIEIAGQVNNLDNREPLPGVSVHIKGTVAGTSTDNEGNFLIRTRLKFPFTLIFSSIGYETQEYEVKGTGSKLAIALNTQTVLGREVVVTASRVAENILKSPVAIEKLDIRTLKETPAPSFYGALENVKGVQMTTSRLTF